ncbi:MAG: alpha-glucosidase [Osedax symbiont Rs2]|nr:MAG: alpha-glucosidase [Osedax symbiont Rs2]
MSFNQENHAQKGSSKVNDERDWWRGAVIYQIYPRSFQDSNGDGIGDLLGIIRRLPYVASLGVDAIWLSPFFTSPMLDFGYDVSDYCDVDPMFGTLADFDLLLLEAHRLGLKVMIDLVLSHTSDQHPWFEQSRQSRNNDKHDWFVWADAKGCADGTGPNEPRQAPNNWLSIFGGSAWQWDANRQQYYLHNFLSSQPDLNFHNTAVQDALLQVARFWMRRKVDGFRLDTINFYFHDKQLRDNPILPSEQRNSTIAPQVNPYNHQEHLYDKNRPENIAFLRRFRATMDEFENVAAVGEVGDAQRGMQIMTQYTAGDDLIQMCYAFDFLSPEVLDAQRIAAVINLFQQHSSDSWSCWAYSNHDVIRHPSRWQLDSSGQKLMNSLLLSLQGSVCLYQGEELGLNEGRVDFDQLQDPYGKEFWPKFKGRDGCRTPMVWSDTAVNAGFSKVQPWLPVDAQQQLKAVCVQDSDSTSSLAFYREMLGFRKSFSALIKGQLVNLKVSAAILSFERVFEQQRIFCAFNLSDQEQALTVDSFESNIPWAQGWLPLQGLSYQYSCSATQLLLPAWQAFYAIKNGNVDD